MSTRGVIARLGGVYPPQFYGRYHHWDSYPSGLGHTLWELYHEQFHRDLEAMSRFLMDEHPAGWSSINGADFRLESGFTELITKSALAQNLNGGASQKEDAALNKGQRPECYCHGDRSEEAWQVTEKNAAGSGCEWAYALVRGQTPQQDVMVILSSFRPSGRKMIGYFGQGDPQALWAVVTVVGLQSQEPDWEALGRTPPLKHPGVLKLSSDTNGFQCKPSSRTLAKPDAQARSLAQERQSRGLQYLGQRLMGGGAAVFVWEEDNTTLLSLIRSQRLLNCAGAFDWGDEGSGSAQLALAILLDFTTDEEFALQHHQSFQRQVIAHIACDEPFWCLTTPQIESFLQPCLETSESGDAES